MDIAQQNEILNQFIARRLVQHRIRSGMSQEKLAEHLGLKPGEVQHIESGLQHLEAIRLYEACALFGTSLTAFFECYKGFEEQYQSRQGLSAA